MATSLPKSSQAQHNNMHVLNVHTPRSSYAVVHSLQQDTFQALCVKLAKKEGVSADRLQGSHHGGGGWLKYEWNEGVWNLDDGECMSQGAFGFVLASSRP